MAGRAILMQQELFWQEGYTEIRQPELIEICQSRLKEECSGAVNVTAATSHLLGFMVVVLQVTKVHN